MEINLFDNNFSHTTCANPHRPVDNLSYKKPPVVEWDGVTVFTDEYCLTDIPHKVNSRYKIAWALESPAIKPDVYNHWEDLVDVFDKIYLCNPNINHPKVKIIEWGTCWIPLKECKVYDKTQLLSIIASEKRHTIGQKLRHEVIQSIQKNIDVWGRGYNNFENRQTPFKQYMYSIVIENCVYPGYYTEKLLDCFATGCIPIYYGCPNTKSRFDERGFYTFNNVSELLNILNSISIEDYNSKLDYINYNFNQVEKYSSPDKNLLNNLIEDGFIN